MDTRSPEERSRIMAAVHSKNTTTELVVRRFLWAHGIRYRIHPAYLPGRPDIAITRCKLAIFIHGCLWHGHDGCPRGRIPKSRVKYWKAKIKANRIRDRLIAERLEAEGWRQLVVWGCQLRTQKAASLTLPKILDSIVTTCADVVQNDRRRTRSPRRSRRSP